MNSDSSFRKYAPFWNKYRPAILKMMQASPNEVQEYQFMSHELRGVDQKPKGGFNFRISLSQSKPSSDSTVSEIASDFIHMLRQSQTGSALIAAHRYDIVLDKNQLLRISRQDDDAKVKAVTE